MNIPVKDIAIKLRWNTNSGKLAYLSKKIREDGGVVLRCTDPKTGKRVAMMVDHEDPDVFNLFKCLIQEQDWTTDDLTKITSNN